ncbi:GPR1/FUN34/yaaH family-domain-containing protein [Scheffersomyces amazonensis]|uniref:GPR1/FUN34/yaaH family-domain-containing protein n=1 Tax=Scheffersomyces amazonensis TaxID=1078765 RepID=UPI00315CE61A
MQAFGGTLNPGLAPYPKNEFANPSVLGLNAFSLPTFLLGLYNVHANNVQIPNVIVGLAFFVGGIGQTLCGVWEFVIGNTFGATTMCSYGAFWLSYGAIQTPAFGILEAYAAAPEQATTAIGFYLLGWTLLTFMFWLLVLKSTYVFVGLFTTLLIGFSLTTAAYLTENMYLGKVGGGFFIVCSFCGWYLAWSGVATKQNSYLTYYHFLLPQPKPKMMH